MKLGTALQLLQLKRSTISHQALAHGVERHTERVLQFTDKSVRDREFALMRHAKAVVLEHLKQVDSTGAQLSLQLL